MARNIRRVVMSWLAGLGTVALLSLPACSGARYEPFTYTAVGDMRPGPGLFTGQIGEFIVLRREKD
jgi:hypothetical protein